VGRRRGEGVWTSCEIDSYKEKKIASSRIRGIRNDGKYYKFPL
jgi:hypothetical protein